MKYIILELPGGKAVPVIFSDLLNHRNVAHALITNNPELLGGVVSAGFVSLDQLHLLSGDSISLGIGPRPGDDLEMLSHDHFTQPVSIPDPTGTSNEV